MPRLLLLLVIVLTESSQVPAFPFTDSHIIDRKSHGSFELLIYEDEYEGGFRILLEGKKEYAEVGYRFYTSLGEGIKPCKSLGCDIAGDGVPNFVVWHWSGGVHCCFSAIVFELGPRLRVLGRFDGEDSTPHFVDVDGDGIFEVLIRDSTFAY